LIPIKFLAWFALIACQPSIQSNEQGLSLRIPKAIEQGSQQDRFFAGAAHWRSLGF
jgi:hypothetical protein